MVTAYMLIQTTVGRSQEITRVIREIPGVVVADEVTGPYDIIVRCEDASIDDLGRHIVAKIQQIDGIQRTVTCPAMSLQ